MFYQGNRVQCSNCKCDKHFYVNSEAEQDQMSQRFRFSDFAFLLCPIAICLLACYCLFLVCLRVSHLLSLSHSSIHPLTHDILNTDCNVRRESSQACIKVITPILALSFVSYIIIVTIFCIEENTHFPWQVLELEIPRTNCLINSGSLNSASAMFEVQYTGWCITRVSSFCSPCNQLIKLHLHVSRRYR